MQFFTLQSKPDEFKTNSLIICLPETKEIKGSWLKKLNEASNFALEASLKAEEFSGKLGESITFHKPKGFKADRIILLGLGDRKKIYHDSYRRALGRAAQQKTVKQSKSIAIFIDNPKESSLVQALVEGFILGGFKMLDYKTGENKKKSATNKVSFLVEQNRDLNRVDKTVDRGIIIAEGQILARRLAMTPANDLTPRKYAQKAEKLAKENKFRCKILDEQAIKKENMGALLSVAQGSDEPPRFIILEYNGAPKSQKPIVLVGKGVTFDSGGISLKPSLNMGEMKQDMAGSAAVVATMVTVARLKLKRNVVALIPTTENMPSGKATRPGDIVTARNGMTIEIINTDAEGRLILADALDYANKYKPQAVIDIATLTGATLFILGYAGAPFVGNNSKLAGLLKDASENTAERIWEMPIWDYHRDLMKSSIADLQNSGGRPAGTITAAAFLENFIGDYPWSHVDIAWVDAEPKGTDYTPAGGTGFGVRLFVEMLSNWKKV